MNLKDALLILSYLASSVAGGLVWWRLRALSRQMEQLHTSIKKGTRRNER